jgi:hypothetical protein
MDAIWILNLSEDERYADYFEELKVNFETSSRENFSNLWYEVVPKTYHQGQSLDERLQTFVKEFVLTLGIRWKFFNELGIHDRLKIFILGDLDEIQTREWFHLLPTVIRRYQHGLTAFSLQSVDITGFLSINYKVHQDLPDEQALFLSQMNWLMKNRQLNMVPFDEVFLFQKPAHNIENHFIRISQFMLFSARNGTRVTTDYSYNEAGSAGVYFEREVHEHNEASLLSAILLHSFNFSQSGIFVNVTEAEKLVYDSALVVNSKTQHLVVVKQLKSGVVTPDFDKSDNNGVMNPMRAMFNPGIITNYYHGFIPGLIAKIVNHCGGLVINAFDRFTLVLQQNKSRILNGLGLEQGLRRSISEIAFGIFSKPELFCSLEQQKKVIGFIKKMIEESKRDFEHSRESSGPDGFNPFPVPEKYSHAYDLAKSELINERQILKDLESDLSSHPVLSAKFIRSILLGLVFLFTLGPVLTWMAEHRIFDLGPFWFIRYLLLVFCISLPVIIALLQIRWLLNRIKKYQIEYQAIMLFRLNVRASEELKKVVHEVYDELLTECEILEKRRQRAAHKLRPVAFVENKFRSNPLFQPLWESFAYSPDETSIKIDIGHSGKFFEKDILSSFPGFRLMHRTTEIHFLDLINEEQRISDLIKDLLDEPARGNLDGNTQFVQSASVNAILLLDVSGSMSELMPDGRSKIDHLRLAVSQLESQDIRWVAFSDDVYHDNNGKSIFTKDEPIPEPQGGTELYKGFMHLNSSRVFGFEKIILISDGLPFAPQSAVEHAKNAGVPVDVIYIGTNTAGEEFMKSLASETGGLMVVASAINLLDNLKKAFTIELNGARSYMKFWELLKLGYYPECSAIAHQFSKRKLMTARISMPQILDGHFNQEGIITWSQSAMPSCTLHPGIAPQVLSKYYSGTARLTNPSLVQLVDSDFVSTAEDVVVELVHVRRLPGLNHLLMHWNAEIEKQIVQNNKSAETTRLCIDFIQGAALTGVFPENIFQHIDNDIK